MPLGLPLKSVRPSAGIVPDGSARSDQLPVSLRTTCVPPEPEGSRDTPPPAVPCRLGLIDADGIPTASFVPAPVCGPSRFRIVVASVVPCFSDPSAVTDRCNGGEPVEDLPVPARANEGESSQLDCECDEGRLTSPPCPPDVDVVDLVDSSPVPGNLNRCITVISTLRVWRGLTRANRAACNGADLPVVRDRGIIKRFEHGLDHPMQLILADLLVRRIVFELFSGSLSSGTRLERSLL